VILAGADFGAGLWQLATFVSPHGSDAARERSRRIREHAHHSMGPVWEANHAWLVFVLTVTWTAYPEAFGSIASTLFGLLLRGRLDSAHDGGEVRGAAADGGPPEAPSAACSARAAPSTPGRRARASCNARPRPRQVVDVAPLTAERSEHRLAAPDPALLDQFERLYRSQFDAITAYFARRSRDPQAVADLTADTFVEAMRSFGGYDPARGPLRAWLFAIARNVYAKHSERDARRREATALHAARRALDPDETEDLERRIDAAERGRALRTALAGLSPLDREAVELVDLAGLTPKEAAATLGVSAGGLRVRLSRARSRLRKEGSIDV
jgi:RNA polymerase sigma factor (sigma-70 family)